MPPINSVQRGHRISWIKAIVTAVVILTVGFGLTAWAGFALSNWMSGWNKPIVHAAPLNQKAIEPQPLDALFAQGERLKRNLNAELSNVKQSAEVSRAEYKRLRDEGQPPNSPDCLRLVDQVKAFEVKANDLGTKIRDLENRIAFLGRKMDSQVDFESFQRKTTALGYGDHEALPSKDGIPGQLSDGDGNDAFMQRTTQNQDAPVKSEAAP